MSVAIFSVLRNSVRLTQRAKPREAEQCHELGPGAAPVDLYIDAGNTSSANFTDAGGHTWLPDQNFSGTLHTTPTFHELVIPALLTTAFACLFNNVLIPWEVCVSSDSTERVMLTIHVQKKGNTVARMANSYQLSEDNRLGSHDMHMSHICTATQVDARRCVTL